ncbi:beta-N-acetylhexosaminidase [Methyloraptor flagellatus]|uniref:beta-N-acetylhexosaminidase n=1 Tax=Methyloraptor flagellatus TaxID=3162530 RepID=A0AAU7XDY4_9HYPH
MTVSAFISGCAGPTLSEDEIAFFREARPWGFILFKRNCETPEQIAALTRALRDAVGRPEAPVLIDQEGGRVQRLGPPHWPVYPAGAVYGAIHAKDQAKGLRAATLGARLIAHDLLALGIDVDCLPVLDVPVRGAHDVIGARAYGRTPEPVAAIGRAVAEGLLAGGVLPIVKHMPGHGRAGVDSHLSLPHVATDRATLSQTDFAPFRANADLPMAMSAHVVFEAIDPDAPATQSAPVIADVIRGEIGFDGLLMTDDLGMEALSGTPADRARRSLDAGIDIVLHCNGKLDQMRAVAEVVGPLDGIAADRAARALTWRRVPAPLDEPAARAELAELLALADA